MQAKRPGLFDVSRGPRFVEPLDPAAIFRTRPVEREARLTTPPLVSTARKEPHHATCHRRNRTEELLITTQLECEIGRGRSFAAVVSRRLLQLAH
jgi:hypothetical protein